MKIGYGLVLMRTAQAGLERGDVHPQKGGTQEQEDRLGDIGFEQGADPGKCDADQDKGRDGARPLPAKPG